MVCRPGMFKLPYGVFMDLTTIQTYLTCRYERYIYDRIAKREKSQKSNRSDTGARYQNWRGGHRHRDARSTLDSPEVYGTLSRDTVDLVYLMQKKDSKKVRRDPPSAFQEFIYLCLKVLIPAGVLFFLILLSYA